MWTFEILFTMIAVGLFAGFVAGLFGVGGGTVLVPVVLWVLQMQGFTELAHAQHIAVATSFSVMVFTSFSSAWSQYRKQAIDWNVFFGMTPGVILGVIAGATIARFLPNHGLQLFFIFFIIAVGLHTLSGKKPKPSRHLPNKKGLFGVGSIFGILSSWVGIGGGSLTVPFLTFCNVPIHRAVGTSAALGWPIALMGAIGYCVAGLDKTNLPPHSLGFIYLPVVAILAIGTIIGAPLGVKMSHRLPADKLKKAFGILMLLIAARMIWVMSV